MSYNRYDNYQRGMEAKGQTFRRVVDRSGWDELYRQLTGARPGQATVESIRREMDPMVAQVALEARDIIREDTPVDTGTLRGSIDTQPNAPSDHSVVTYLHYAPIVEARPPGGPEKGKGAMFAQNLAVVTALFNRRASDWLRRRLRR